MMTHEEYGDVYQREFHRTARLVQSRGATPDQAEDIAQRAWLQGWRVLDQLRERAALLGWINTIALNYHRRSGAYEARYQPLTEGGSRLVLDADLAPLDVAKILAICSPGQRALFECQLGGLTTREIAAKHGVTETAIRVRFLRARREVRSGLETKAAALRESYREKMSATAA
jgi:DNA-directed RNA polymerase specialized sigma24 family protein